MGIVYVSAGKPFNFLANSFWRVLITKGGNGSNTGASEVRFKKNGNKKDGTSLGSGGTHGNAFDDDESTNWAITGEFGEYIGLEFSGAVEIDEIDIVSMFNDNANTLLDYEVQFSDDGIAWTTIWISAGNLPPTANNQTKTNNRPFVINKGAAIVNQRAVAIMGASANAMLNTQSVYAIHGRSNDAMMNTQTVYAVHGSSNDAMVNSINIYAIYDSGS